MDATDARMDALKGAHMAKAIRYGLSVAVALTASTPAWAEYVKEDASRQDLAHLVQGGDSRRDPVATDGESGEPGGASGEPTQAEEAKAQESFQEEWLRMREGYRDGGY